MLVRPPTLKELLETYGDLKLVIVHLTESGFSPEEIERRYGIPYFLIRLYLEGMEPKNPYPFSNVVSYYDRIATFRSVKGKETTLIKFFKIKELDFETKAKLALGQIYEENPKVGPGLIEIAISMVSRMSQHHVRKLFRDYGDYGDVASMLIRKEESTLTVDYVYNAIKFLQNLRSIRERLLFISSLLRESTSNEAKYIIRLILGDLKLGYHEQTVISAISRALGVSVDLLQRACSVLGILNGLLLAPKGNSILSKVKIRPGTFIPPHLAHLYDPDKVEYPVRVEYKYDGSRLQLHKWGSSIWLFSRRAVEKSKTLPEIVEIVKEFNAHSCIVDSEVVAIDQEGKLLPFQSLLIRTVPRKYEKERAEEVRLTIKAFDILYLDGQDLTHLSLSKRLEFLEAVVPYQYLSDGRYCENDVEVIRFYQEALNKGLEGIIIKSLSSPYEIGKRTNRWLKLKPERDTLDCVIIKALYGKGRRAGYYSSYELAIRDPIQRKLYTVGRVSNVPDLLMARFRDIIERTKTSENREGVYVRPTIVLEVTYQEIQKTDEYTSGFALRVPKVVRVRDDKRVEDICTLEKLQKLYEMQYEERFKIKSL